MRNHVGAVALAWVLAGAGAHGQDFETTTHTAANPQNAVRAEAVAALQAHDFARAVKLLGTLAAADPKDAHVLYDLGSAQDALDQNSAAESSYRAAAGADAAFVEPRVALGLLLARSARYAEARTALVAATAITPADDGLRARAYRTLARIDQKTRPVDARDELLAALKLSPETPEDTLLAAELAGAATNGAAAAEAAYRKLLAAHPGDPEATAALAHLLVRAKRDAEAEALLSEALRAHPDDTVLNAQFAGLLNAEGKAAEALPTVVKLHASHPSDTNVTRLLASLYARTGEYAEAEPLYASLAATAPQDVTLLAARGDVLIRLKRYAEAQATLSHAVSQPSLFPAPEDLGAAAGSLAFAASKNDDPRGSLQALAVRATVLPPSPSALFLAAIAHDKLHETKLAQQAYRSFVEVSKGSLPDEEFEARHRLVALEHMK